MPPLDQLPYADQLHFYAEQVLLWIGFGTLVGLLAKAIMPGRDPGGAIATLAMGIGGSVIGCGILMFFSAGNYRPTPLSPPGFLLATGGAFLLLFFYRLFNGNIVKEDGSGRSYRRRPRRVAILEDDL